MRNLWVLLRASALIALGEDMEEGLEVKVPLLGPILLAVQAALAAAADLVDAGALPYPKGPCEVRNVSKRACSAIFRLLMLHRKTAHCTDQKYSQIVLCCIKQKHISIKMFGPVCRLSTAHHITFSRMKSFCLALD